MTEAIEWARLLVDVVFKLLNVAVTLGLYAFLWILYREFMRPFHAKRGTTTPSPKVLLRRLWCRHDYVSRIQDPYGKHYTACTRCGVDVNEGKRPEDRR